MSSSLKNQPYYLKSNIQEKSWREYYIWGTIQEPQAYLPDESIIIPTTTN